jgi:hypothetical protein
VRPSVREHRRARHRQLPVDRRGRHPGQQVGLGVVESSSPRRRSVAGPARPPSAPAACLPGRSTPPRILHGGHDCRTRNSDVSMSQRGGHNKGQARFYRVRGSSAPGLHHEASPPLRAAGPASQVALPVPAPLLTRTGVPSSGRRRGCVSLCLTSCRPSDPRKGVTVPWWRGRRCTKCRGDGVISTSGASKECIACTGTGIDESGHDNLLVGGHETSFSADS